MTSDRRRSGVWLPLYLHLASGYISHYITRTAIRHHSCTSGWVIRHNWKEQNKFEEKCLKVSPPSSDHGLRLPDPEPVGGSAAQIRWLNLKTGAYADSLTSWARVKVKRSGLSTCRENARDPPACGGCSDTWYRPLWHKIFSENRWITSRCDAMTPQNRLGPSGQRIDVLAC